MIEPNSIESVEKRVLGPTRLDDPTEVAPIFVGVALSGRLIEHREHADDRVVPGNRSLDWTLTQLVTVKQFVSPDFGFSRKLQRSRTTESNNF